MITGLKYPPLKSAVNKVEQLPRVLFYKATGCKSAKCAKGAEGLYNAVDTTTGKFLGSIDVTPNHSVQLSYLGTEYRELSKTLHRSGYLYADGKTVKLPYSKEYENVYDIVADEGENLNSEEQRWFSTQAIELLKNLSDKFKRPIVLRGGLVPNSMKLSAIGSCDFVAIPRSARWDEKIGRAIDGQEMGKRCYYLTYGNGGYNEQTYKKVDKYLENNNINSLVYAEYAVHPKVKRPNLITAVKEFFIDTKRIFNEVSNNIQTNLNKEIKVTVE